jgi:hypothetical protein
MGGGGGAGQGLRIDKAVVARGSSWWWGRVGGGCSQRG